MNEARLDEPGWGIRLQTAICLVCSLFPVFAYVTIWSEVIPWGGTDYGRRLTAVGILGGLTGVVLAWIFLLRTRRAPVSKRSRRTILTLVLFSHGSLVLGVKPFWDSWGTTHCYVDNDAVVDLRMIQVAEETYRSDHGRYGTISELMDVEFLDKRFEGTVSTYRFQIDLSGSAFVTTAVSSAGRWDYFIRDKDAVPRYSIDSLRAPRWRAGKPVY